MGNIKPALTQRISVLFAILDGSRLQEGKLIPPSNGCNFNLFERGPRSETGRSVHGFGANAW
jgi:hypothetical protein